MKAGVILSWWGKRLVRLQTSFPMYFHSKNLRNPHFFLQRNLYDLAQRLKLLANLITSLNKGLV